MGNEHSHIPGVEPLQPNDFFTASVLLIDAPPALHGFDLTERKWLLMRSIAISIVRWDSRVTSALSTDQLRLVLNKHAAVVIFDSGLGTSRVPGAPIDPVTAGAIKHLSNVLAQVTKGQSERTKYKLVPLRVSTAATLFDVDMYQHADEYVSSFVRRCNISSEVAARLQWWFPNSPDDVSRFVIGDVLAPDSGAIPKELQRPLKSLLSDLLEAVDAREGYLLESSTLFPVCSAVNETQICFPAAKLRQKAVHMATVLRHVVGPILASTQSHIRFSSTRVGINSHVYIATVVPNTLVAVLVTRELNVGEGLVRLNCAHFAQHFTHVITTTHRNCRVEPLPLPDIDASDSMTAAVP